MISSHKIGDLQRSTALDRDGSKIGKVGEVFLDDETNEPKWITVDTGFFGTSTSFVPLEGATFDGAEVRVACEKDQVKEAPRLDADGHLDHRQEEELYRYYGLSYPWAAAGDPTTGDPTDRSTGHETMTRSEERLEVGTEGHESGRVRLRKYTTTEQENVTVPVTKEQVVVDRKPLDGAPGKAGEISDDDEVREVTAREEHAVVTKETVPVEEVTVAKEAVTEQEKVAADLRKEHVEVDEDDSSR